MKIEEIEEKLQIAIKKYENKFRTLPNDLTFEEFNELIKPEKDEVDKCDRQLRMLKIEMSLKPISKYNSHMLIDEFIELVKDGTFNDFDGNGYYATENKESNIEIYPSDIIENEYRKDFTHIVWYNK